MELTKYYLVDWVMYVFIFTNLILLANKNRIGFIYGAAASIFGVVMGYMADSIAMMVVNAIFILSNIKGYYAWENVFGSED